MERFKLHPLVSEMQEQLRTGQITRREFMRGATLLGTSLTVASALASCAPAAEEPVVEEEESVVEEEAVEETVEEVAGVPRGGTMRVATRVQRLDHPARLSWIEGANFVRHICEYLAVTMDDGITIPWLLESWEANDTVDVWTLKLRQGVTFNDGSDFTADDVVFNFQQWLDPDVGSSMAGLMSYLTPEGIEKVDDYTVRLNLASPNIGVPEHLYHYPAVIVSHKFEGDIIAAPVGTGPFTLEEYSETERAVLKARTDYWKMGEDGEPLPYLDEIVHVDLGADQTAWLSALQSGQVDKIFNVLPEQVETVRAMDGITLQEGATGATYVTRMRVDMEPWDNNLVRQALKLCQNREDLLAISHFGEGTLALDAHVSPVHPEYVDLPIPEYNPEKAKELLAEAGYPDGIDVTIMAMSDTPEGAIAVALQEMAAPGGFNITVDLVPSSQYWEVWTDIPLGVTVWAHRPLGTMIPALAYTADADGNAVAWNETRWVDEEYSELLREAEKTLDLAKRREIVGKMMEIQNERGSVGIPYWRNAWHAFSDKFKNHRWDPNPIDDFTEVWYEA